MKGMKGKNHEVGQSLISHKVVQTKDEETNMISAGSLDITVVDYLESRNREMDAMRENASFVSTNSRIMQRLPRHMRRRAASHNVKRLPRELREAAEKEISQSASNKSGGVKGKKHVVTSEAKVRKCQSRLHRRRKRQLLQVDNRLKRENVWLETHIWHAKRFHMTDIWGYKIPLYPNDHGVRAAYRNTVNQCLVFDLSYYCCIEINGPPEAILSGLSKLTSSDAGPTFGSLKYISGTREGCLVLYCENTYPFQALGEVKFMWKAQINSNNVDTARSLWIWTHPASYDSIWDQIKHLFQNTEDVRTVDDKNTATIVSVRSLKDSLCRFRLVGPGSQAILRRVFMPARMNDKDPDVSTSFWWQRLNDQEGYCDMFHQQAENWCTMETCETSSHLMPHSVYGLIVRDPRVIEPHTGGREGNHEKYNGPMKRLETWMSVSPIWDENVRESVKTTMMKTHDLNALKSKNLIPGSLLNLGSLESRVPVIFIQNPGVAKVISHNRNVYAHETPGFGCGWDVIVPSGWAMPFWIALNHCSAHSAGLRELKHMHFEKAELLFPDGYPDTLAGKQINFDHYREAEEKYKKIPPAKKVNYEKLKVKAPFHFPWTELVGEWKEMVSEKHTGSISTEPECRASNEFYCLRDRSSLELLQTAVKFCKEPIGHQHKQKLSKKKNELISTEKDTCFSMAKQSTLEACLTNLRNLSCEPCLVPVHILMCGRGTPDIFSMICLPEKDDIVKFLNSPHNPGEVEEVLQSSYKEPNLTEKQKKNLVASSEQPAKRQRLEDSGNDWKLNLEFKSAMISPCEQISKSSSRHSEKVLQLPVKKDIVSFCSRLNFGYIIDGGFSHSRSCGSGVGFVALSGLLSLLENQKRQVTSIVDEQKEDNKQHLKRKMTETGKEKLEVKNFQSFSDTIVLVRSVRSKFYRFAKLNVLQL